MSKRGGYFILELLVVVSILCLLASMSIANLGFFKRFSLKTEFDILCSTFDYLQRASIADNSEYCLIFDRQKNCYSF